MNQILSLDCPNCHKENLVDNGDMSDQTVGDVEDFKCWNCGKSFKIEGDGEVGAEMVDDESSNEGEQRMPRRKR
jgi:transposase-like protein